MDVILIGVLIASGLLGAVIWIWGGPEPPIDRWMAGRRKSCLQTGTGEEASREEACQEA